MNRFQRFRQRLTLVWVVAFVLSNMLYSEPSQAQWWRPSSWFSRPRWGPPSRNYTGAAQRGGNCPKVTTPLTALAPLYQAEDGSQFILGATASDYPTLWFYLPYEIGDRPTDQTNQQTNHTADKPTAELRIEEQDSQTQEVHQRVVANLPAAKPGVIGFRLPVTEAPLVAGKTYHWLLVVRCDPNDASTNQFTEVSLHRVESPMPPPAIASTLLQQLNFYTENGLWTETMSLCNQVRTGDTALFAAWSKTIEEVTFDGIDAQRVVNECRAGKQKLLGQ